MAITRESVALLASGLAPMFFGAYLALAADPDIATPGEHKNGAFHQACGPDIDKFCGAAKSREDRHACVTQNKDKFSDGCKSFIAAHPRGQHHDGENGQGGAPSH